MKVYAVERSYEDYDVQNDYELYSSLEMAYARCMEIEADSNYAKLYTWEVDTQKTKLLYSTIARLEEEFQAQEDLEDYEEKGRNCAILTAWRYPTLTDSLGDPTKEEDLIWEYLHSNHSNYEEWEAVDQDIAARKRVLLLGEDFIRLKQIINN